jgi:hypothetical protein
MREDRHMLAALNREQFRAGYTRDERFRVLRERHHAIGRAVHDQGWDCNLFQRADSLNADCTEFIDAFEKSTNFPTRQASHW